MALHWQWPRVTVAALAAAPLPAAAVLVDTLAVVAIGILCRDGSGLSGPHSIRHPGRNASRRPPNSLPPVATCKKGQQSYPFSSRYRYGLGSLQLSLARLGREVVVRAERVRR